MRRQGPPRVSRRAAKRTSARSSTVRDLGRGAAPGSRPPARLRRADGTWRPEAAAAASSTGSSGVSSAASSESSAAATRCPTRGRLLGGSVEIRGDDAVRPLGRERQMARSLLGVGDDVGERPVNGTALPERRLFVADRAEQRVCEAQARVVEDEDVLPHSRIERFEDHLPVPVRLGDELDRRSGERRDLEEDVAASPSAAGRGDRRAAPAGSRALGNVRLAASLVFVRASSRPSSSAKNGLPAVSPVARASSGRVSSTPSRSLSRRWSAPRLSGAKPDPTSAASSGKARASSNGASTSGPVAASRRQADRLVAQAPERDLEHAGRR